MRCGPYWMLKWKADEWEAQWVAASASMLLTRERT